jgi:2-oxoglutarate ferredoxin oxidoreductase subunit delta
MAKKGRILIKRELCKGCGLCIRACPKSLIERDTAPNGSACYPAKVSDTGRCSACESCRTVCPDLCIDVYEEIAAEAAA